VLAGMSALACILLCVVGSTITCVTRCTTRPSSG